MSDRFTDRGVVVTGAAAGMGRAISKAFLGEGARVVILDIDGERVGRTADELAQEAGADRVLAMKCDVTNADDVAQTVALCEEHLGGIDVLVNNAGVITMHEVVELSEQDWDFVMDVNAKGVFLMVRAALPGMLQREKANIVNIASQAGKRGYKLFTHYCASKAAVIVFSKGVALEVAPKVRINCLCPGVVNTEMMDREYEWEEAMTGEPRAQIQARWLAGIPMQRFQEPEHIARVALFVASDDASEMTGQAINITGGMVME